jgi:type II secretory pathway component GspD/PulD (secretin)
VLLVILTLMLPVHQVMAEQILQTFEVRYRPAHELARQIKPVLDAQTRLTVSGNLLLVRATRSELAHIRSLLETLDRPLRSYQVTVMQRQGEGRGTQGLNVQAPIPIGRHGQVNFGNDGGDRTRVKVYSTQSQRDEEQAQQLRVMEGTPAFIRTGKVVPVREEQIRSGREGREISRTVSFREAQDGFFVTVSPMGDRVQVAISAFMQDINPEEVTPNQSLQTQVQVTPGEWFVIGSQNSDSSRREDGVMVYTTRDQRGRHIEVMLKIEEVY